MENNDSKEMKEKVIVKRNHILDALKRCLEKEVYSQISLEDVAQEAGISKGGLRHYFPTREGLYISLIEDFFSNIEKDQIAIMQGLELDKKDQDFVSTLFSVERFLLNQKNIRLFINILLYGFEDEKIMAIIQKFIRNHLHLCTYMTVDPETEMTDPQGGSEFHGRMIQIILLCSGLFEFVDPIKMDSAHLVEYALKLARGKQE
ncbi:MAG: TetR/AcrR family transcriptional regulator [bacterium]|nr:TetR/AcrR family transcriptional regulator [bacterium]